MEAVRNALKKALANKNDSSVSTETNTDNSNTSSDNDSSDTTTETTTPTTAEDKVYTGTAMCEPDEEEEFQAYKLTMEVVVSTDGTVKKIQNIKWDSKSSSNRAYYTMAQKSMVSQLVASGLNTSVKYDTVSGATCSSNALINAYKNAISQINK